MSRSVWSARGGAVLAAVLGSAVLLSGCGVADSQPGPGVADTGGDERIAIDEVDDLAGGLCAIPADPAGGQAPGSRAEVRALALQFLAQRAAATQLLDDYDATLYSGYEQAISQTEQQTAELPGEQRSAANAANEASYYYQAALIGVGLELLGEEDSPGADLDAASARGTEAFTTWVEDHDVVINPLFGLTIEEGTFTPTDRDELSVPVSGLATGTPSPAQLCG